MCHLTKFSECTYKVAIPILETTKLSHEEFTEFAESPIPTEW